MSQWGKFSFDACSTTREGVPFHTSSRARECLRSKSRERNSRRQIAAIERDSEPDRLLLPHHRHLVPLDQRHLFPPRRRACRRRRGGAIFRLEEDNVRLLFDFGVSESGRSRPSPAAEKVRKGSTRAQLGEQTEVDPIHDAGAGTGSWIRGRGREDGRSGGGGGGGGRRWWWRRRSRSGSGMRRKVSRRLLLLLVVLRSGSQWRRRRQVLLLPDVRNRHGRRRRRRR